MAITGDQPATRAVNTTGRHSHRARSRNRHASSRNYHVRNVRSLAASFAVISGILITAWLIRDVGITRNYDIFIDEITYTRIADNISQGHGLVLYGKPFDLHPPAAFALYAAAIRVLKLHGTIAQLLFGLRPFVALLGAGTCATTYGLSKSIAGWRAAACAAIIAAIDPFQIFFDSRVMLEAPGQLAATLAILFFAISLRARTDQTSWSFVAISGLMAGIAMCTKEDFGLVIALTFFISLITGWITDRRKSAAALLIMSSCYILSESLVIVSRGFTPWWNQSASGLRRLIGSTQISGFNSPTVHVSLLSRVAANSTHFGITYLILAFGVLAALLKVAFVIRHRATWFSSSDSTDRGRLLIALWSTAAAAYLGYATLFGTLEEQMYYVAFIPCLCSLVVLLFEVIFHADNKWRNLAAILLAVVILADSAVWVSVHRTPGDEYSKLLAWAPQHLPNGSRVAVTEYSAQFLLKGVVLSQYATVPELIKHHVQYVLLSTTLVDQGYGLGTASFERYLQRHATVVFMATGPSQGELLLYNVQSFTGAASER